MSLMEPSGFSQQSYAAPVVAIVGPTAGGKSALALALAQHYGAAIVSADSRQVYRYMDIGTAKPTPAEQASVKHYLIDVVAPDDAYSAQRFAAESERVLRLMANQGRLALVVGGTGFYVRALLDRPTFPAVPPDFAQRAEWNRQAEVEGPEALHALLATKDQQSAARIHPRNVARTIRALEIVTSGDASIPDLEYREPIPALYLGLTADRAILHQRAARRVLEQMEAGLVEETESLLAMGYDPASGPLAGFGYREMVAYLRTQCTRAETIERYTIATRQYMRRQFTWFHADKRIQWLDIQNDALAQARELIDQWLARDGSISP